MSATPRRLPAGASVTVAAVVTLSGCAQKAAGGDGAIKVTASDTACEVSKAEFPSGHVTLDVEN